MNDVTSFFNREIKEKDAISFLINGRKKNNQFYNYLTRKIISQLEVSYHLYPIGPALLVYNTKNILSPIFEDKDPYVLSKIDKLDKGNKDHLVFSKAYTDKLSMRWEYNISLEEFKEKISKYLTKEQNEQVKGHYKNLKKWIEITITNKLNSMPNIEVEKQIYIKCFDNYMKSTNEFKKYIEYLKKDIISNYKVYQIVFTHDFKRARLLEIIHYIREKIIGDMLIKYDNNYRKDDLTTLTNNKFFKATVKPNQIVSSLIALDNEYEAAKKINNTEKYIEAVTIIFQKFIKIHPYKDGNGRTSRLLLDIMLLNKDIFPPILYDTNYDRANLDTPSDEYTLHNNEKPIIEFIKNRIKITNKEYIK